MHLVPGLVLCIAVSLAASCLRATEQRLFGGIWLESLVLAILLGAVIRTCWTPDARWRPGVAFGAKRLLEVAVVLLGASVSAATVLAAGPALLVGIAVVVAAAILAGYGLGRMLGLKHRMATLIACGNAICGNSAIAAVAPVIGAEGEDVATSIAFTAVLGVVAVLGLPALGLALHASGPRFGALAGLTVYAVPQVLAATAPLGATAVQVGTLVKLVRVLMLGPVCCVLALLAARPAAHDGRPGSRQPASPKPALRRLVPWFILGFLAMMAARSAGLIPAAALPAIATAASLLTLVSMAALGLGTNLRAVAGAGARVSAAVVLSLLVLGLLSLGLIRLLCLG